MNCEETRALLGAYADGELDAAGNLQIEGHLRTCAECARMVENERALGAALRSSALRFRAPDGLREVLLDALSTGTASGEIEDGQTGVNPVSGRPRLQVVRDPAQDARELLRIPSASRSKPWAAFAKVAAIFVFGALVGSLGFLTYTHQYKMPDLLAQEIVSAHVRSLLSENHLTDVLSSDRHTVKPWFEGKVDFSPPVTDPTAQGFPLVGGRLEYLNGRTVASLVYRRDKHVINVFVWPLGTGEERNGDQSESTRQGYHLLQWQGAGMQWWVVSDLNETELGQFASLLQRPPSR
jgi:anti-sigma factor RsiW